VELVISCGGGLVLIICGVVQMMGKKAVICFSRYKPGLRNATETAVSVDETATEIQTRHLSNTDQMLYRCESILN